ncbi:hypothetical protein D5086_005088 [Populus alba]|uniref:Uncharacterized protein n=1 Tax=Populus alba TaxID=43335 RepID=A0ACC4CUE2_POPAL
MTKLPSPTTVLEGPYMGKSSRFQSSSFRIIRARECYGSFRSCSPEKGQLGTVVPSKRRVKEKGRFLGSWSWVRRGLKGKRESGGGSYVFPSSVDREPADHCVNEEEEMISSSDNVKMTRSGSLSAVSNARSQFWVSSRLNLPKFPIILTYVRFLSELPFLKRGPISPAKQLAKCNNVSLLLRVGEYLRGLEAGGALEEQGAEERPRASDLTYLGGHHRIEKVQLIICTPLGMVLCSIDLRYFSFNENDVFIVAFPTAPCLFSYYAVICTGFGRAFTCNLHLIGQKNYRTLL